MQQCSTVTDYLDTLTRELEFDRPLARRVRQEVEDHLWQAVADNPNAAPVEAQHRAIAAFGDPRDIASQYAALSLWRQTRHVGVILVLATAGIFVAMIGRGVWSRLMQWALSPDLQEVRRIGLLIDGYAYKLALVIGVVGLIYIGTRRVSVSFHAAWRDQMKRCWLLCAAAAVPLTASVITDAALMALRLFNEGVPAVALVPLASLAAEIALAGVLLAQLRKTSRRATLAASLFAN